MVLAFEQMRKLTDWSDQAAIENDTLVRSIAHNMSVPQRFRGVMLEVITEFVTPPGMSAEEAAKNLALAVEEQL